MKGIMNENQLAFVREHKFDNPLIHKIDSIIDKCYGDCHKNYFHTFKYRCMYNIIFTNIRNNEIANLPFSDESFGLHELNKNLTVARQNGFFIFSHIIKLTIKINSNLQSISICYHLNFRIPLCHRLFFRRISQNKEHIENI